MTLPWVRLLGELVTTGGRDWRGAVLWLVFGPFRRQTVLNLAFLLFSLPLGLLYFVLLALITLPGLALTPVLIGFPVLLLAVAVARWANGVERDLAWRWVGVAIPAPLRGQGERLLRRIGRFLRDPVTWTNVLYLLLKAPIGFGLWWLLWHALARIAWLISWPIAATVDPRFGDPMPSVAIGSFVAGVVLVIPALHGVNGLAFVYGRYARLMLGPSDVTLRVEQSEAEAARERVNAARADQSRRELMVNVSHELRTPVASIRGHVESLMIAVEEADETPGQVALDGAQLTSYLGIIHRETERLGALVDDLLALARSEAGELRLAVHPIDIVAVIREVHENLAPLGWRDRSVTVIADDRGPAVSMALADRDRLAQVLLNLVRNAITHTPAGGLVSMSISDRRPDGSPDPDGVTIQVADTGAGIPQADLDRIFERFYRVDASRNRASGGFGLGLSIVHDLVTAMGGTITAQSTVGEGSLFRVRLRRPSVEPVAIRPARQDPHRVPARSTAP